MFLSPIIAGGLGALGAGSIGGGVLIGGTGLLSTVTAGTLTMVQNVVGISIALGASYASNALTRKSGLSSTNATIKQALPARWIDLGRVKTAGAIVYYEAPGLYLGMVKVLSCTRIEEIEKVNFDDYQTVATGWNTGAVVGTISGPWTGQVLAQAGLGSDDQVALSLLAGTSAGFSSWTADHRLRGLAALAMVCAQGDQKSFQTHFPNGAPSPSAIIKGGWTPDPRDPAHDLTDPTTWSYSDNLARALLRFVLDRDGWGLEVADIDLPSWQAACDDCDALVPTPSGTEPRYRAWGRWSTTDERSSTLADMLAAGGAQLLEQPDGTLALFVGKDRTPTITLDDSVITDFDLDRFPDALSRVDGVKARIVWEGAKWEEQEVPTVYADGAFFGSAPDVEDLALKWCPSPYQAQRLANGSLRQKRAEWSGTIKTNLAGLRAFGEPVIRLVISELGIDGTFEVTSQPVLDLAALSVSIGVRSYDPSTWTLAAADMGEMSSSPDIAHDYTPPAIVGLSASLSGLTVTAEWTATGDEGTYTIEVEWRVYDAGAGAEDGWHTAEDVTFGTGSAAFGVPATDDYEVRVRRVSPRGYVSAWASSMVGWADWLDGTPPTLSAAFARDAYTLSGDPVPASVLFSRTGDAKWVVSATGEDQQVAANTLAFDYASGRRQLVLEGAATNLSFPSAAPTVAQAITVTAQSYTLSFKGAGTITLSGAATGTVTGAGANRRKTYTFTPAAGTLTLTYSGDVRRVQLETGPIASSYIATTSATVTRAADVVAFSTAAVAVLSTSGPCSLAWRGTIRRLVASQRIVGMTAGNILQGHSSNSSIRLAGTSTNIGALATIPGDVGICCAWDSAGRSISADGGTPVSDTTVFTYSMAGLALGGTGMTAGTRHEIDELLIWPVRGSAAALQAQSHTYGG